VYKHILIATDGSEMAAKAVTQGLALAKALGAKATAVTVSEPWNFVLAALAEREHRPEPLAEYEQCTDAAEKRIFWIVHQLARRLDQACATLHIKDRYPAEGISRGCRSQRLRSHCDGVQGATRFRHSAAR
jgi:nucleotide-binding universal stress UspA family protein